MPLINKFQINAPNVSVNDDEIIADYTYTYTEVINSGETPSFVPKSKNYSFKTDKHVPKLGYVYTFFIMPSSLN